MSYFLSSACRYEEIYQPAHIYRFTGPCVVTKKQYSVDVPAAGLYRYHQGEFIQKCFPDMPAGDREWLMSGISPEGWAQTMGSEEEDAS